MKEKWVKEMNEKKKDVLTDVPPLRQMISQLVYGNKIQAGNCTRCQKKVDLEKDFKDLEPVYEKEYGISGLCVACQDISFVDPDEP